MAVCAHYRIPHSTLLDWPADDRSKAIWWHIRTKTTCSGCGTRPEEWDEDLGGDRHAYAATEYRCPGCEQVQAKQASLGDEQGRGVYVALKPNPKEVTRAQS